jgi:hypothetical protein
MENDYFFGESGDGVSFTPANQSASGGWFSDAFGFLDKAVNTGFDVIGGVRDRVVEYSGGISDALDFGDSFFGDDEPSSRNTEVNVSELDRSNPAAFKNMMNSNNMLYIVGGLAVLGVIIYAGRK